LVSRIDDWPGVDGYFGEAEVRILQAMRAVARALAKQEVAVNASWSKAEAYFRRSLAVARKQQAVLGLA
jgi:hypothetical protein